MILLDKPVKDEIEILVGDKRKHFGIPGTINNKMAIQVTRIDEEGDELDE